MIFKVNQTAEKSIVDFKDGVDCYKGPYHVEHFNAGYSLAS